MTRKKLASPACAADEADDVYMGYASKTEIAEFLRDLDAGKIDHARLEAFLPRVRDDVLYAELKKRLNLPAGPASRAAARGKVATPPPATSSGRAYSRRRRPARP